MITLEQFKDALSNAYHKQYYNALLGEALKTSSARELFLSLNDIALKQIFELEFLVRGVKNNIIDYVETQAIVRCNAKLTLNLINSYSGLIAWGGESFQHYNPSVRVRKRVEFYVNEFFSPNGTITEKRRKVILDYLNDVKEHIRYISSHIRNRDFYCPIRRLESIHDYSVTLLQDWMYIISDFITSHDSSCYHDSYLDYTVKTFSQILEVEAKFIPWLHRFYVSDKSHECWLDYDSTSKQFNISTFAGGGELKQQLVKESYSIA